MPQATVPAQSGTRRKNRFPAWVFPTAVFLLSAGMTLAVYFYLARQATLEWQASVSRDAALIGTEIRDRLRTHAQFLRGIRAFFAASDHVSVAEWDAFTRQLQLERNVHGIQAYGFAALTPPGKQPAAGSGEKRADGASIRIFPPPAPDTATLPVSLLAPATPHNLMAIGFNLMSEARRAEAVEMARDRDDVALSRRIELVQEGALGGRQPGLLMVLPVYRANAPVGTVEERRAAFAGVVYAAYRMGDFMQSFNYANSGILSLRIFDEDSFNSDRGDLALSLLYDSVHARDAKVVDERELEFGQRNWHLRFSAPELRSSDDGPAYLLIAGLLVSALLAAVSHGQSTYRLRAESLARGMTRELRLSEERFKLAADGANDGIWDRDLVTGTVWRSERMKQLLGFPEDTDTESVEFFLSRVHPDDAAQLDAALKKHMVDRLPYSVEYRFRKGDGSWAWFRSRAQGVWNAEGQAIRLVGSITDISEQRAADQRLQHYRDFLATVLKFIPHPVFVKNRRREYIAVNAAFCALVDRREEDILGRVELGRTPLPAEIADTIREMDERVLNGDGEQVGEHVLPLRRGLRTVIARKALAEDPDGNPILIGTLTDITDLRQAERERAFADRQRRAILDAATEVSIIATDTAGTITVFNRGAEKMLGYRADEVVGRCTPAIIHLAPEVEERGRFLSAEMGREIAGFDVFVAVPRAYGAERREWTYVRKDGSHLTVSLVVTALRGEKEEVTGYLGIATDVTERNRAQLELERQSARMATIIEHIPGGVSLIDNELHFIAANQQLKKVLEFPDSLFAAGPPSLYEVALFNARRGDYGPGDPHALAMAVVERSRNPVPHHFERTRPNGRTIEVRGTPLPDGGFVTIYTDITERKAVEQELTRHRDHLQEIVAERTADLLAAKDTAERASSAKSEFLANMSHELRTPMHSVLSFASLGEEKALSAEQEKLAHYFRRVHQSGERLLGLLNDLLDLSKLEAGMMHIEPREQDLLPIIREAVTECESWAAKRGIRVAMELMEDSMPAAVDALRIGQVIRNLLSNAIKFSPENGVVTVRIGFDALPRGRRAGDPHETPATTLSVTDHGIGIPEGELEHIFDKFVQSSKTKTGAGGTGLGLSICREIVLAHRGRIVACNNPDGGATFTVTLPRFLPAKRS